MSSRPFRDRRHPLLSLLGHVPGPTPAPHTRSIRCPTPSSRMNASTFADFRHVTSLKVRNMTSEHLGTLRHSWTAIRGFSPASRNVTLRQQV
ncbi:hypothetical protein DACRYDRAFT_25526 [Dacryopinax primogenitus]|uniref:Uncharacterized protein n=1 Tax=Dacryopinax primogenitus (strain DJM 731) TaxID=1858805 RepID=M5FQ35_DACPD|nr:uncharacterized protein DACRYDRAFT_25526 [Dacryopinax primogenitus]EJT96694.1 hypothetical protein DACRYDRAFT_25526 [Dacryopinax primogenitus]